MKKCFSHLFVDTIGIVSAQTILKPEIPEIRFSVIDYGASASALDNTDAIQKTIDEL